MSGKYNLGDPKDEVKKAKGSKLADPKDQVKLAVHGSHHSGTHGVSERVVKKILGK